MTRISSFLKPAVPVAAATFLIQALPLRPFASNAARQDLAPQAADGNLDPTFGNGGKVTTDFSGRADFADGIAIQSDGKILLAGGRDAPGSARSFALARYNPDGSLDTSYGSGGKVTTDFFGSGSVPDALVIQADDKSVAAGGPLIPSTTVSGHSLDSIPTAALMSHLARAAK